MKLPRPIGLVLRLAITFAACYLAFSQVELADVLPLLAHLPLAVLLAVLCMIHLGQLVSAMRTRYYLHVEGIDFPVGASLRLNYIGGLYGTLLPGGAGGDAYKAWWLKRHKQGRLLNMVKIMVSGRLNGLWTLGVLLCLLMSFSEPIHATIPYATPLLGATALGGTFTYYAIGRFFLKEPVAVQWHAARYSSVLQLLMAMTAATLAYGLGEGAHALEYTILFILSCVLSMLPISLGGIGIRELALLHGSRLFGLSEQTGVSLAFIFTLSMLTVPLVGALLHLFAHPKTSTSDTKHDVSAI